MRTNIPDFLTVTELARVFDARGISIPRNTIRYWIYQGKVPAHQFGKGGRWIFPVAVLDRLPGQVENREQVKQALGYINSP